MPRSSTGYKYVLLVRPGLYLSDRALDELQAAMETVCARGVAAAHRQTGSRELLHDRVLLLAYTADGTLAGYCRATLGCVASRGDALYVEPARVAGSAADQGLARTLPAALVQRFLLRHRPFSGLWVGQTSDGDIAVETSASSRPHEVAVRLRRFGIGDLLRDRVLQLLRQSAVVLSPATAAGYAGGASSLTPSTRRGSRWRPTHPRR